MVQKILKSTDPRLRQKSKPVRKVDKKITTLIRDLKETLAIQKDPEGVGLAAPQIGKNLRVFVMKYQGFEKAVINPEVLEIIKEKKGEIKKSRKKSDIMEGCLSLPQYYGPLGRADKVRLKYLNKKGEEKEEVFENFLAQIVLHEIDHLNGVLFVDRLIEQKKPLYKLNKDEWEEVEI